MKYIWENENWTDFIWDSKKLLPLISKARQTQGKLLAAVKNIGIILTKEAQAEILIEEAVKTSAIEGEVLNRDSVRSSVVRHLGLDKAAFVRSERHIDGLIEILLDATGNYDKPLSAKRLKSWQAALFPTGYSGLHKIRTGQWRGGDVQVVSGPVGKERVHFQAPPMERVEQEIKEFLHWWEKSLGTEDGFLRAGIAHFWFVTIHPFEDGNGRVTRALTDMALAQDERLHIRFYSLSSRIMEEKNMYYDILEKCSKSKQDITEWLEWFLGCLTRSIEKSESIIAKVLVKAQFWQTYGQTNLNDRQRKVINRFLDYGEGQFQGGLTTRKYIALTKTSRATAFREISDLLEHKILVQNTKGKGRSVSYDLNWQGSK